MLPTKNQESGPMALVTVNGKVLQWAREIRGLKLDEAALILDVSSADLEAYENETKKPSIGFLRKMSRRYRLNFSSLLMPSPLSPPTLPKDYRRRYGKKRLSMDTLVAIEEINEALDAFEDISIDLRSIVPRLKIGSAKITDNPAEIAAHERQRFGVTVAQQRKWHGMAYARNQWRRHIEARGVFTYMMKLPPKELSGFSILRDDLAAVCVNDSSVSEGAKIFTLFHEYCHLLLRNGAISDNNDSGRVERFCNYFAAAFLIPKDELEGAIEHSFRGIETPHEFSDAEIRQLATWFRVSNGATALRLEKTGFAPPGFYSRHAAPWDVVPAPKPIPKGQQPSAIRSQIKRIGHLHATIVVEAVKRKALNTLDASELFGLQLRPHTLKSIEAALG